MRIELPARALRVAALAAVPMLGAVAGAALDERHHLGYSTWRTACRSAGPRIPTLIDFTLQLLPSATIGLLLAGLLVLAAGLLLPRRVAKNCAAAHVGCAVTLPAMLMLCALLPPWWMLAADAILATLVGLMVRAWFERCVTPRPPASVRLPTPGPTRA